jgi:hypothetical protein
MGVRNKFNNTQESVGETVDVPIIEDAWTRRFLKDSSPLMKKAQK